MCTRPITHNNRTFACRTCNSCLAVRRNQWVARAMAEKSYYAHTLCVALTYSEETPHSRIAARMFIYDDVRAFMSRLRADLRRKKIDPEIRFIVAGEQGDRNGRCHWHIILYSNSDLLACGEFYGMKNGKKIRLTDRYDILSDNSEDGKKIRLNWSMWKHGFATIQSPDQGAMAYVLSYCLKDQFTAEKSKGTMREHKTENFATGMFRMSKKPAIGERWLFDKIARLAEKNSVLPSLKFTIPEFSGHFIPSGTFRQKALIGLAAANQAAIYFTGANAPQWSTLLASLSKNPTDLELLTNEKIEEDEDFDDFARRIDLKQREIAEKTRHYYFRKNCGNALPCEGCLARLSEQTLAQIGVEKYIDGDPGTGFFSYRSAPGFDLLETRQSTPAGRLNAYCFRRGSAEARAVYPESGALPPSPPGTIGVS